MADQQISWMTLEKGVPIVTSDDQEVGRVADVIADAQKDIFSGLTFRHGLLGKDHFVPADLIESMTAERVRLTIPSASVEDKIEPYEG